MAQRPGRVRRQLGVAGAATLLLVTACSTASSHPRPRVAGQAITVVAAENVWGSLARQLGGSHVRVTSIISSPDADPHAYEPTASDARAVATADLTIVNGVGYDSWASK